jgi:CheY-like chemotaxis protein
MKKILIVEDELIIQLVNKQVLSDAGFQITDAVATGEDAIESVRTNPPDIILMDIKLDGEMDGIDAMEHIRKFSTIPVIYITGNSDSYHMKRAKETNMHAFMIKPVEFETLIKSINKALET